jgi:hypothetical protein
MSARVASVFDWTWICPIDPAVAVGDTMIDIVQIGASREGLFPTELREDGSLSERRCIARRCTVPDAIEPYRAYSYST